MSTSTRPKLASLLLATCVALSSGGTASATPPVAARRIAVLVGANAAPAGRRELRYAKDDAQRMADTLRRVGGFASPDVHLLLEPTPEALLSLIDQLAKRASASEDTLLLFYYSGHSDGQALYPSGATLSLAELREHLARLHARVRVGILDTCRGGSWTQAKDLSPGPPLPASDLAALSSEGSVLVAASAGFENAHEADAVSGSFFTHHLSAGLLGAADRSEDGSVTLQEAFEYARERTVRDSARHAPVPQHPSFAIDLRGRQDIVLSQIGEGQNSLELLQSRGPLEVIRLASGTTVAELPPGVRRARLVLPQGRYLIRRLDGGEIHSLEVDVPAGGVALVSEQQLRATLGAELAMKGGDRLAPLSLATSLPAGYWEWTLGLGVATGPAQVGSAAGLGTSSQLGSLERSFDFATSLSHAFTDRFTWYLPLPAFSYRFGEPGRFELVSRLGLVEAGWSSIGGLRGAGDAGLSLRLWTGRDQSFIAGASASSRFSVQLEDSQPATGQRSWGASASFGYGWTIHDIVSLYLGVAYFRSAFERQQEGDLAVAHVLQLGSVLMLGYRSLPLLSLHLSRTFSLDLDASWAISLQTGGLYDRYLAGFAWQF